MIPYMSAAMISSFVPPFIETAVAYFVAPQNNNIFIAILINIVASPNVMIFKGTESAFAIGFIIVLAIPKISRDIRIAFVSP